MATDGEWKMIFKIMIASSVIFFTLYLCLLLGCWSAAFALAAIALAQFLTCNFISNKIVNDRMVEDEKHR